MDAADAAAAAGNGTTSDQAASRDVTENPGHHPAPATYRPWWLDDPELSDRYRR